VSAQLVDAVTGNHVWAERYDRNIQDILALQEDVAHSVAATASGRVGATGRDRALRLSQTALNAYDLLFRAKALVLRYDRTDNDQARLCLEKAIELDPASARAHAVLAWCQLHNYMWYWTADREKALGKAYELARHAVVLDETDSFTRLMLGYAHLLRRE